MPLSGAKRPDLIRNSAKSWIQALITDRTFSSQILSVSGYEILLQPGMTDAIKTLLDHNFRTTTIATDPREVPEANLLVEPFVQLNASSGYKVDCHVELVFRDAATKTIVADLHDTSVGTHDYSRVATDIATSVAASVVFLPMGGAGAHVVDSVLAKGDTLALKANVERSLTLALDAMSTDIQRSAALSRPKENANPHSAFQIASPALPLSSRPTVLDNASPTPRDRRRVALVVGNSGYRYVSRLRNPDNDAQLVASTLLSFGFTLVGGAAQVDLDKPAFDRAIRKFGNQIQDTSVAVFYYAGHAIQLHGTNYLVPVSANPAKESDVDFQLIDVQVLLDQLDTAQSRLKYSPFGRL
jgi:hypothetical protein